MLGSISQGAIWVPGWCWSRSDPHEPPSVGEAVEGGGSGGMCLGWGGVGWGAGCVGVLGSWGVRGQEVPPPAPSRSGLGERDGDGNKDGGQGQGTGPGMRVMMGVGTGRRDRGDGVEAGNGGRDWHYEEDGDKKWDGDHDRDDDRDGDRDNGRDGAGCGGDGDEVRDGDRAGGSSGDSACPRARNSDVSGTAMLTGIIKMMVMMMMMVVAKRKVSATRPPSRMTPVSKLGQGEAVRPECADGSGGAGARLGGATLCFGGWLEQLRRGAHGRFMQLLSNSQTRIRVRQAMGGLWAAAPRIALGVPPVCRGAPAQPAGPNTWAWSRGSSGVCREHQGFWNCRSGWRTSQMWGGQMLL